MKVLKFGGSSVASSENIKNVIEIIREKSANTKIFVVVSAFGGTTDQLIRAGEQAFTGAESYLNELSQIEQRHQAVVHELISPQKQAVVLSNVQAKLAELKALLEGVALLKEFSKKTSDKLVSFGELLSSYIIFEALLNNNIDANYKNTQELIVTNEEYTNAAVYFEPTNERIKAYSQENKKNVVMLPGFVARSTKNIETTLGRGGSDYTASIIAAALNAEIVEIWTDVSGIYTANPKCVPQATPIKKLSYEEAMELSYFGAEVLYLPTIKPVLEKNIPLCIKNTFDPSSEGTLVVKEADQTGIIKGISYVDNLSLLTLEGHGMASAPSFSQRLFGALASANVYTSFITQASSEHSICIAVEKKYAEISKKATDEEFYHELKIGAIKPLIVEDNNAMIAIVGENMKNHQGVSAKMFNALGRNNVNIRAIAQGASEKNITAIIAHKDAKKALNVLHAAFFENHTKQINLFMVGVGNVGGKLLEQIEQQQSYLLEHLKIQLRVVAIANSRKMLFQKHGIELNSYKEALEASEDLNLAEFQKRVFELNYRNSIFVDNTANKNISEFYASYLKKSISVVTCNKVACSSSHENYSYIKQLAKEYDAPFLFETNVGAGLPIINTLNNLIASGDKIRSIQAVLSGSLNFIFNNLSEQQSFSEVVEKAMENGYTEPDPRIDLSGIDVARKILILARECGAKMELEDVENKSFLPENLTKTESVKEFLSMLKESNLHFEDIHKKAAEKGSELKFVGKFHNGKAEVSLEEVPKGHPFYGLTGSDNIVLFYTERYSQQPLIVKGAGAGADVTAAGLFGDIIRVRDK